MSTKSIIDIEVNDASFSRFREKFAEYSAELDAMPEAWQKLGDAMGESTKGLEAGAFTAKDALAIAATQAGFMAETLREAVKAQQNLHRETSNSGKSMDKLHKSAQGVGKAISTVGGWLVKLGAISGIAGLFSGIGFADLAGAAFNRSRSSGRLGVSPGVLASFQTNAQQFLGTSDLENAANTKNDISKAGFLASLGFRNYKDVAKMDSGDLAFEELRRARAAYLRNPAMAEQNPAIIAYKALGGDLGNVRNAAQPGGLSELNAAQSRYHESIGALEINRKTQEEWNSLKITLDKAGMTIQTVLIDRLAPLAPKIETLANDVSGFITSFVNSKNFDSAVKMVEGGFDTFENFLKKTDWHAIGNDVGKFGKEMKVIVDKLGFLLPKEMPKISDAQNKANTNSFLLGFTPGVGAGLVLGQGIANIFGGIASTVQRTQFSTSLLKKIGAPFTPSNLAFLNQWQAQEGTSAAFNPLATTQGARGARNFNSVGVKDYLNSLQGLDATAKTLKNGYYPDIVAGLRQGNPWGNSHVASELNTWGTGSGWYNAKSKIAKSVFEHIISTIDDDAKKYGKNWSSHLPKDVAAFISAAHLTSKEKSITDVSALNKAIRAALTRRVPKPAHVSITNSTAANVSHSINAVAYS